MVRSSARSALMAGVVLVLVLCGAAPALAVAWSDMDDGVPAAYAVTVDEVSQVSSGYPDGSWRPWQNITRGQFAKMAAAALGVAPVSPETPTFSDVRPQDDAYSYVQAAYFAGLMGGVGGGRFDPASPITREQAGAVAARLVAKTVEHGPASMAEEEIDTALAAFRDAALVSRTLRAEVAFAVAHGLIKGTTAGELAPGAPMTRMAAAAVLIRATRPIPVVVDMSDNGTTRALRVGDTLQVVLRGNPTTGYGWQVDLTADDAGVIRQVGEPVYAPDSDLLGSGGTYTFTFETVAVGEVALRLVYQRPWETVPALEMFAVTLRVANASFEPDSRLLDGSAWRLEAWSVSSLHPGAFEITAAFEAGRISGKAAVNLYGGSYVADPTGAFWVGSLVSTKMAGPEPAMRAESLYFELLRQARAFKAETEELTLLDGHGNELLIFARVD